MYWIPTVTTVLLAFLVQIMIMVGYAWFPKFRKPKESYNCWLLRGFRSVAFLFLIVSALTFIDTNIKYIFFGVAGYNNIFTYLAAILLTFVLAAEIIIGVVFIAPNRKGLITFTIVLVVYLYLSQFYIVQVNSLEIEIFGGTYDAFLVIMILPILIGMITAFILTLIEMLLNLINKEKRIEDKPFWNKQEKAKKVFNLYFNLILYGLITAEFILNLEGMSLLLWLTYLF